MADVLTWMWQGMLVAAALAGVLCAAPARRMTSATRYWICWLGLVVVLVLPLVPILLGAMSAAGAGAAAASGAALTLPSAPPVLVVSAVAAWALTVAGALGRLALDMRRLRRMKGRARPMPEARQRRLPLWQDVRDRGRRTELAVLDGPITAAVLGFRRPMVVVPGALLDTLTDPELDQVVAHEQAHVERRDDWANLLQRIIAVPFGLHPAVWLINRWIRRERELAADEWVALRTGAPRAYARCLARVAETLAWPEAPRLASGAVGSGGAVARRVAHLLDGRRVRARRPSPWVLGSATVLSAIVAFLLGGSTPAVELGAGGAAATRVRVGPPASSSHRVLAVLGVPAGRTRTGSQARVAGIGLPARRAPEPLAAIHCSAAKGRCGCSPQRGRTESDCSFGPAYRSRLATSDCRRTGPSRRRWKRSPAPGSHGGLGRNVPARHSGPGSRRPVRRPAAPSAGSGHRLPEHSPAGGEQAIGRTARALQHPG